MLLPDDERVYAFTRRLGDVELLVLGNFSGEPVDAGRPGGVGGRRGAWSARRRPAAASRSRPWEGRAYRRAAAQ